MTTPTETPTTDPLEGVPADERTRILAAAHRIAARHCRDIDAYTTTYNDALSREAAAYRARQTAPPAYPDCCLRHRTNGPRGGSCGTLAYEGPDATPETLTRAEAEERLSDAGIRLNTIDDMLSSSQKWLDGMHGLVGPKTRVILRAYVRGLDVTPETPAATSTIADAFAATLAFLRSLMAHTFHPDVVALRDLIQRVAEGQAEAGAREVARLTHARDAASKLYVAARAVATMWQSDDPTVLTREGMNALCSALDPAEADACSQEATRRDGLDAELAATRSALTAVGFPTQDGEMLDKTFARAWEWCVTTAHKAQAPQRTSAAHWGVERVTDEEIAVLASAQIEDTGYRLHRFQDGYPDGVPRAVFVHADEDPVGIPMSIAEEPMRLAQRLASEVRALRAELKTVRASYQVRETEWREGRVRLDPSETPPAAAMLHVLGPPPACVRCKRCRYESTMGALAPGDTCPNEGCGGILRAKHRAPAAPPLTDGELAEIEARTLGPGPLAGDGELLRRCRAEIVSLRAALTHEQHEHRIKASLYEMALKDIERLEAEIKSLRTHDRGDLL